MASERPIVLILGPTAGGKTELALALARALPGGGECLCADSMQVYRGMDIGTAKPTPEEQTAAPHHLLDLVEPDDDGFSVDTWLGLAERAIEDIRRRGRYAIVVGGTNLYIQALLAGLFDGPAPDPTLRARLDAADAQALRAWLERVDPTAAERIHPNDRKRTVRAIEVHELTGAPISACQREWGSDRVRRDVRIIGLQWPVPEINRRINRRVQSMIEAGLVEEVRGLHAGARLGRQASAALGYRQILDHLEGRQTLEEAIEQIKIRTRRFAKQQRTWLRRFSRHPRSLWLDAGKTPQEDIARQSLTFMMDPPDPTSESARFGAVGTRPPRDSS